MSRARPSKVDPRVKRTRRLLREALLSLLREKSFDALTVQDITERAEINRVTFYLHYRDKHDLLTQAMKDVVDELNAEFESEGGPFPTLDGGVPEALVRWFKHAAAHPEIYQLMLGRGGMAAFAAQVRQHIEQLMAPWLEQMPRQERGAVPLAIHSRFLASACLGVTGWWIEKRMPHSAEEMAAWLWRLLASAR